MEKDRSRDVFNKNFMLKDIRALCSSDEIYETARADIEYGLDYDSVCEYAGSNLNKEQVKMYSRCLREGIEKEAVKIITKKELTKAQMEMAYDFYKDGVPLESIKAVTDSGKNAAAMKEMYEKVLSAVSKADDKAEKETEKYLKELMAQINKAVKAIKCSDEKYERLKEAILNLKESGVIGNSHLMDGEREDYIRQIAERDNRISLKQDEVNRAYSQISRMKNELNDVKAENEKLRVEAEKLEAAEKEEKYIQPDYIKMNGYYSVPVLNDRKKTAGQMSVERTFKREKRNVVSMFAGLLTGKKSRISLAKKVIDGELLVEQIECIREAVEAGVSEERLCEIIDKNVPAAKIKSIARLSLIEQKKKSGGISNE